MIERHSPAMMSSGSGMDMSSMMGGSGGAYDVTAYVTMPEGASGAKAGRAIEELCADLPCQVTASGSMDSMSTYLAGSGVRYVCDQTYETLRAAEAAVVTSGTATLETALLGVPEVVVYRTLWLQVKLRPYVLKVPYVSLVNLNLSLIHI